MFIIKGYNVLDKKTAGVVEKIRFSAFSNLFCQSERDLSSYRESLEQEFSKNKNRDVKIAFLMFEIAGQSEDGRIINKFMEGFDVDEIAQAVGTSKDYVSALLETFLHKTKV